MGLALPSPSLDPLRLAAVESPDAGVLSSAVPLSWCPIRRGMRTGLAVALVAWPSSLLAGCPLASLSSVTQFANVVCSKT